jgi:hypothetical protein
VFENLLPEPHNGRILDLLFDLATWHAYDKLWLHTTDTLNFFDAATVSLSHSVRKFLRTTCEDYITQELPQETAMRGRRSAAKAQKGQHVPKMSSGPKRKKLNLNMYKYHALGDYVNTIRERGMTDNYTTQPVFYITCQGLVLIEHIG